jgi:elongation factor P
MLTFMDKETFDQIEIASDWVGERALFLQDGMEVVVESYEGRPISIRMPQNVTMTVVEADPSLKGQTAASSYKSATLENGVKVQVPPFIEAGAKIIVTTDDPTYVKRAE